MAPWADVLYAADLRWWDIKGPKDFKGHRIVAVRSYNRNEDIAEAVKRGLDWVEVAPKKGLNFDPICSGDFSGNQAINLAYKLGAEVVALLGYDCQMTGGQSHFFGDHPAGLNAPNAKRMKTWADNLAILAKDAEKVGLEVWNCSRETAVTCFPRMDIDDAVRAIERRRAAQVSGDLPRSQLSHGAEAHGASHA